MESAEVSVDTGKCIGCGICMERCFIKAVKIDNGGCAIDDERCRVCGRCAESCPVKAISVTYDPSVIDKEVEHILSLVNQN